ncbi:hypothetical protein MSAR_18800 [Mycolicibacterium sarraceniae]|uniref:Uncharacterized protein n=1 Tax=Mycolicibacterium sarraceniae TaxID=1534348 RepID=A0A7I7SP02_9MYCO|nr:hypothetical protein MSAR_18800 [Mycolicibacterium sarraceniae]
MTVLGSVDRDQLRALVAEVVRDVVGSLTPQAASPAAGPPARPAPPAGVPPSRPVVPVGIQPTGPLAADANARTDTIRIANDQDLDAFVRRLLKLFDNPKARADLRAGRLSFRLAGGGHGAPAAARRIDSGAVTERHVADMATSGGVLVLGPKAVLTPLAREKARVLGITIEKERK